MWGSRVSYSQRRHEIVIPIGIALMVVNAQLWSAGGERLTLSMIWNFLASHVGTIEVRVLLFDLKIMSKDAGLGQ